MKLEKTLLALSIGIIVSNPALAISYNIPNSTPANNSNQNGTITSGVDNITMALLHKSNLGL